VPLCAHLDTEALQGNTVDAFTRGGRGEVDGNYLSD
jgi:hypothetical protein